MCYAELQSLAPRTNRQRFRRVLTYSILLESVFVSGAIFCQLFVDLCTQNISSFLSAICWPVLPENLILFVSYLLTCAPRTSHLFFVSLLLTSAPRTTHPVDGASELKIKAKSMALESTALEQTYRAVYLHNLLHFSTHITFRSLCCIFGLNSRWNKLFVNEFLFLLNVLYFIMIVSLCYCI